MRVVSEELWRERERERERKTGLELVIRVERRLPRLLLVFSPTDGRPACWAPTPPWRHFKAKYVMWWSGSTQMGADSSVEGVWQGCQHKRPVQSEGQDENGHNARINIFILLGKIRVIYHAENKLFDPVKMKLRNPWYDIQFPTNCCMHLSSIFIVLGYKTNKADASQMADIATFVLLLQYQMRWGGWDPWTPACPLWKILPVNVRHCDSAKGAGGGHTFKTTWFICETSYESQKGCVSGQ